MNVKMTAKVSKTTLKYSDILQGGIRSANI